MRSIKYEEDTNFGMSFILSRVLLAPCLSYELYISSLPITNYPIYRILSRVSPAPHLSEERLASVPPLRQDLKLLNPFSSVKLSSQVLTTLIYRFRECHVEGDLKNEENLVKVVYILDIH